MLHGTSWSMLLAGAGLLIGLYYLALALWCYRGKIRKWRRTKTLLSPPSASPQEGETEEEGKGEAYLSYEELAHVAAQVRHLILEEAGKGTGKEALLVQLRTALDSYGGLRSPASRGALHHYIIRQVQACCGISLAENELASQPEAPGQRANDSDNPHLTQSI